MTQLPWLEDLYRRDGERLARYLGRMVGPDAAPDLVHDAFVRLDRRPIPDAEQSSRMLFRVGTNLAIDHLRRQQRWQRVQRLLRPSAAAGDPASADERVRAALATIPPEQAAALVLRLCEGRSRAEIAALLGISEAAVKSRLVRGRVAFAAAYRREEAH